MSVHARPCQSLFLLLAALAPAAYAAAPPETLALHADRLLDVRTGKIVHDALVVIEGDHIRAVGASAEVTVPPGARRIELGDRTLLPGLMDLHVHLSAGSPKARRGESLFNGPIDNAFMAADNARLTLELGFTTVRSAGENDFIDVALDKAIEKGVAVGPRIIPAGCQISMTGGHGDDTGWPPGVFEYGPEQGIADGPEKLLRAVRYQIKHGARVIKMMVSGGVTGLEATLDVQQFSEAEMRTVVEEAARNGLKVMAHSHNLGATLAAVRAGVASIEHGTALDAEAVKLMKERGTYLVPTPLAGEIDLSGSPLMQAKAEEANRNMKGSFALALGAGVKIAYGTDSGAVRQGQNGRQFALLVASGMTPLAAIQAATVNAADLAGVKDRGALEPGLLADVIAVPGNPLEDVRVLERVEMVMKGGAVYLAPK